MSLIAIRFRRRFRYSFLAGAILPVAMILAATTTAHPATTQPQTKEKAHKRNTEHHWYQFGRASWYGEQFQGQQTASGESFNMHDMTCAHRSLPLGSLVRVTNLRNHRSVVVRVNDRGPVPESRVIDLSAAAAKLLGFRSRGVAPVRLDLIDSSPSPAEVAHLTWPEQTRE